MKYCLALLLCMAVVAPVWADRADVVERENVAYHAAATLAADGLIPGLTTRDFAGDWLFTRGQFADITAQLLQADLRTSIYSYERNQQLVAILAHEFEPELTAMGVEVEPYGERSTYAFGQARGWWTDDSQADVDKHFNAYGRASISTVLGKDSRLYIAGGNERDYFRGGDEHFPILESAYADFHVWRLNCRVGRSEHNWGPAFTGSGIFSDNAPPMTYGQFQLDVRLPIIGWHKITQVMTTFTENGERKWFLGRTWEHRVNDRISYTFGETAKLSVSPPAPLLVLPFYWSQQIFASGKGDEINTVASWETTYRAGEKWTLYSQFNVDDITSPIDFGGGVTKRPKKVNYTMGAHFGDLQGPSRSDLVVEIIRTDRNTYLHKNPAVNDTFDGFILGHPYGGDQKALYVRYQKRLAEKWSGTFELDLRRQITGYTTGPGDSNRYALGVSYDFTKAISATARVIPYKETAADGDETSGTRFYLEVLAGF